MPPGTIYNAYGKPIQVAGHPIDGPIAESLLKPKAHGTVEFDPEWIKKMQESYQPDEAFKPKTISMEEFAQASVIKRKQPGRGGKAATESSLWATLVVPNDDPVKEGEERKPYKKINVQGWDKLNEVYQTDGWRGMKLRETMGVKLSQSQLQEAFAEDGKKLKEFFPGEIGDSRQTTLSQAPNDEFHPILLGPFHRNQYIHDFLDQASKAFEGYHHNPVLKSAINIIVNFVLGDGVKVAAKHPSCQRAWDEYQEKIAATGISYNERLRTLMKDAYVIGETFLHDPPDAEGVPQFKMWDATTVWEIMTNPRDIEEIFYAYRQFPTQYQIPYSAKGMKTPPVSEYVIEQIPPDEWLQIKVNATIGEKRGRSDLFSVLGWGKRFKDWFDAAVVAGQINNAFVLWWEIEGSQDDVDAIRNNQDFTRVPAPGSAWFTNKQVTPHLLRPEGGVQAGDKTGEQLLIIIAVSLNLPPEYLGVGGSGTRATALKRGEPAAKFFEQRQQQVREIVQWQYRRVIKAAQKLGKIPQEQPKKGMVTAIVNELRMMNFTTAVTLIQRLLMNQPFMEPIDTSAEVVMPDLQPENNAEKLEMLQKGRVSKVLSQETFSRRVAALLDEQDYDFDEEQAKMQQELERGIMSLDTMPAASPKNDKPKPGSAASDREYRANTNDKPAPIA